jgi:hypothetical protein
MTVLTLKAAVDMLTPAQLDNLGQYIAARKAELQDAAVLREIVADNKTNPNTSAIPPSPTEWSHTRMAVWEETQRQLAEERAAARTQ